MIMCSVLYSSLMVKFISVNFVICFVTLYWTVSEMLYVHELVYMESCGVFHYVIVCLWFLGVVCCYIQNFVQPFIMKQCIFHFRQLYKTNQNFQIYFVLKICEAIKNFISQCVCVDVYFQFF